MNTRTSRQGSARHCRDQWLFVQSDAAHWPCLGPAPYTTPFQRGRWGSFQQAQERGFFRTSGVPSLRMPSLPQIGSFAEAELGRAPPTMHRGIGRRSNGPNWGNQRLHVLRRAALSWSKTVGLDHPNGPSEWNMVEPLDAIFHVMQRFMPAIFALTVVGGVRGPSMRRATPLQVVVGCRISA